jgi:hypothetical protein
MPAIDATVGGATANSYETLAEANVYFDERLPLPTPWVASGNTSIRALLMATRVLDAMSQPHKTLVISKDNKIKYYLTASQWTGSPATTTQRLAWPRIGMFDRNGNEIPSDVIPAELKDAESELAGQLIIADSTLDNTVSVQGITSIKAGSVSLTFKEAIDAHVIPDAVRNLMPASWFTDELVTPAQRASFQVIP